EMWSTVASFNLFRTQTNSSTIACNNPLRSPFFKGEILMNYSESCWSATSKKLNTEGDLIYTSFN
ncbi:MAG: hypothetical protein WAT71_10785, partial [Ignavibacteria bacterium]